MGGGAWWGGQGMYLKITQWDLENASIYSHIIIIHIKIEVHVLDDLYVVFGYNFGRPH